MARRCRGRQSGCHSGRADADFNQPLRLSVSQRREGRIPRRFLELFGILQQHREAFGRRGQKHQGSSQYRASQRTAPGLIHPGDTATKRQFQAEIGPRHHGLARGSKSQPASPNTRLAAKTANPAR